MHVFVKERRVLSGLFMPRPEHLTPNNHTTRDGTVLETDAIEEILSRDRSHFWKVKRAKEKEWEFTQSCVMTRRNRNIMQSSQLPTDSCRFVQNLLNEIWISQNNWKMPNHTNIWRPKMAFFSENIFFENAPPWKRNHWKPKSQKMSNHTNNWAINSWIIPNHKRDKAKDDASGKCPDVTNQNAPWFRPRYPQLTSPSEDSNWGPTSPAQHSPLRKKNKRACTDSVEAALHHVSTSWAVCSRFNWQVHGQYFEQVCVGGEFFAWQGPRQ